MAFNLFPNVVAGTGAGSSYNVKKYKESEKAENGKVSSIQIVIATTATVKVQVSNDGSTWSDLTSGDTASAAYDVGYKYNFIRGNVTAWTAGDVDILVELE